MSKRGENIYKRKDGRWEGRYVKCRTPQGKIQYGYVYGKSYSEAKAKLKENASTPIRASINQMAQFTLYGEILKAWLLSAKNRVKESTISRYNHIVQRHIQPFLGNYQISEIGAALLEEYIDYLLQHGRLDGSGGLSPKSVSKGSFTISATDSGGLSCEINVIVKSINIGLMTLIGMGVLALVTAVIFAILLYIALTKPFRGTISAQSYCNGVYRGIPRNPKRGWEKLARFGMENVGLDYQKSYFQATGQNYIFLVTDKEVFYNGQSTKKVRIQSGAAVTIYTSRDSTCSINIRFDSRVQGGSRRSAPRGGCRPPQPRRR